MKKLCDCKWKTFSITTIFSISATKSSIDKGKLVDGEGEYPYITRSDISNGWGLMVPKQEKYLLDESNVITIGLDTQTVFYQPAAFYTGQNIQVLRNGHMNRYVAHFLIPIIKTQMVKFNWGGNGATLTRLRKLVLKLPVNSKGDPDYAFMEEYMRTMEAKLLAKYKAHLDELLKLDVSCGGGQKLSDKKWRGFEVMELFKIESGKRLESRCMKRGLRPFVGAADSGNGVTNFISNTNASLDSHVLGVNYNGNGMGIGFYHPYEALFSDDVKRFHLKNYPDDKYVMLFLKVAILKQKPKFDYGYKFNAERMNRQRLFLPVDSNGNPDYEFMRDYMRKEERKIIVSMIERLAAVA